MTQRINITVSPDLLARIDEAAAAEHLTRSGFLRAAALDRLAHEQPSAGASHVAEERVAYAARPRAADLLAAFFSARSDVVAAYLFGSVASGEAGPASDIDVAVLLPDELSATDRWSTQADLAGRIGTVFGTNEVDVVILNDAPVQVAHAAMLEGIPVAGGHRADRAAFEARIRDLYEADRPATRARNDALRERIATGGFFSG